MASLLNLPAHADLLVGGVFDVALKDHPLEGREVFIVGHTAEGALALPYPLDLSLLPTLFPTSEGLTLKYGDLAAQRVLAMRRLFAATPPRDAPPSRQRHVKTAMVLCAGLGTRLRPLTERYPKPALPFFGGPLIRYTFALLQHAGIEKVVINTHHLPKVMEETARIEAERLGLDLESSHEKTIHGTAGGLRDAKKHLSDGPLLLVNGDAFLSVDLSRLIAEHVARKSDASLAVTPMPEGESFGAVEAEGDGRVRRIAGVGRVGGRLTRWHFIGVHVLEPAIFDFIPKKGEQDINRVVYPAMIEAGKAVNAIETSIGAWADLGTPKRYLEACEDVMTGLCDFTALGEHAPITSEEAAGLRSKGFRGRVHTSADARVGLGAVLVRAQLGPDTVTGKGAVLRRAAVLPGTRIADGEELDGVLASGELRLDAK